MSEASTVERVALVAEIAKRQPSIGRTALMKYLYLLQTVRSVPLGFRFQLYAYGPYDTSVLDTIGTADAWGGIRETLVTYPNGFSGYEIEAGSDIEKLVRLSGGFIDRHDEDIKWVVDSFRGYNAAGLELIGTMVFADREALIANQKLSEQALVESVLEIKPRFSKDQANQIAKELARLNVLKAVA